jgi:nucleoside-diphosphate-sugar epimerase
MACTPGRGASSPRASRSSTRRKGAGSLDEEAPVLAGIPGSFGGALTAVADLERQVAAVDGIVLRFGWLYGPGTYYDRGGPQAEEALQMRGASNAKAKRELGWQPAHASWRQGFRDSPA